MVGTRIWLPPGVARLSGFFGLLAIGGGRNHGSREDRGNRHESYFRWLPVLATALVDVPFFIAGTLKIAYDLILYREFVSVRPPEEAY